MKYDKVNFEHGHPMLNLFKIEQFKILNDTA